LVTVDELQIPNIIPVIVCAILIDQFPHCAICNQVLEIHRLLPIIARPTNKPKNMMISSLSSCSHNHS